MTASAGTVVMLAYYAPPAVGVAAQRVAGMVRLLPRHGWAPVVVVPRSVHYHRREAGGEDSRHLEGALEVMVANNPEPSRWLRRLVWRRGAGEVADVGGAAGPGAVREVEAVRTGAAGGWLRRQLRSWVYVPDAQAGWIGPAARAAAEAVRRHGTGGPVVIFSSSVPFSAHFAAMRAAAATGAGWVAEYRDPWSADPARLATLPALRRMVDRRLDAAVVSRAGRIVVTTEATGALFDATFAAGSRIRVVRNGWIRSVADAAPPADGPFTLVHAGTLLRPEWGARLLRALRAVQPGRGKRIRLDVFGPVEVWRAAAREARAAGADPEGFLHLHGLIPPTEVPEHLVRASALLLLHPDPVRGPAVVPGKLYDYVGARRPVLAWITAESEAARLLREHADARIVDDAEGEGLEAELERLAGEHAAGALMGPRVDEERIRPLSLDSQVERLAAVLREAAR